MAVLAWEAVLFSVLVITFFILFGSSISCTALSPLSSNLMSMLPLLQSVYSYSSPLSTLPPALPYPLRVKELGGACGALRLLWQIGYRDYRLLFVCLLLPVTDLLNVEGRIIR